MSMDDQLEQRRLAAEAARQERLRQLEARRAQQQSASSGADRPAAAPATRPSPSSTSPPGEEIPPWLRKLLDPTAPSGAPPVRPVARPAERMERVEPMDRSGPMPARPMPRPAETPIPRPPVQTMPRRREEPPEPPIHRQPPPISAPPPPRQAPQAAAAPIFETAHMSKMEGAGPVVHRREIVRNLHNPKRLREALIMSEILSKPVALRDQ